VASASAVLKTPRGRRRDPDEKDGRPHHKNAPVGVYVLTTPRHRTVYLWCSPISVATILVPWTRGSQGGRQRVCDARPGGSESVEGGAVKLEYGDDATAVLKGPDRDVWWLFLVAVTALLCGEVWMTRRIARANSLAARLGRARAARPSEDGRLNNGR